MTFSSQERLVFKKGYKIIAGVDEAGRGSLAGPVAGAAVLIDKNNLPDLKGIKIKDSKQLSEKQRKEVFEAIKQEPNIKWSVSFVWPKVIDKINILKATELAWLRSLKKFKKWPDFLFLDGNKTLNNLKIKQRAVVKGDEKILSVSLASIIAKVSRDRLMQRLDKKYPKYGFAQHKGYGTKLHLERLKKFGPCEIHRKSFKPVSANKKSNMILIKNITIITQNSKRQLIKNGGLVIEKDRIKDIGQTKNIEKKYRRQVEKVIDGQGKIVMPGLINTHGHLAMSLLRGYADDMNLEEWWLKRVYPIESKFGRKEVYWGSLLSMLEMIKSGTTCFTDFYYYQDQVNGAAKEIGIRGILGCAILDLPTFAFKNTTEAFKKIKDLIKKKLMNMALAPHMFQTTSLKTYQKCKKIANENNLLLTTHLAETKQEVEYCLKKYKKRPIEVLAKAGILDKKTLLVHCCWLNKKEIKILAQSKASVSHCPVSNMKLASGTMPLPEMIKAGINISLGTDSACSNNALDMFQEMKTAALLHKVNQLNPMATDAQMILDMATINGAKALNLEKEIGSLEKGKKADLIILNFEEPHLLPVYNYISHLTYSVKSSDVETVIINGKIIMEKRKIKRTRINKILDKIKEFAILKNK